LVKIQTKTVGEVEVTEKQKLIFEDGIMGFEVIKSYYLIDMPDSPFYTLQAEDEVDVAFIVIQPESFMKEYVPMIPISEYKTIGIDKKEDAIDLVIVTIPDDPINMTANLQGPIILNKETKNAKQTISINDSYNTRHPIIEGLKKNYGEDT